jgi:hypothetical protein
MFAVDPFAEKHDIGNIQGLDVSYPDWDETVYEKADFAFLPVFQQLRAFTRYPRG